HPRLVGYDGRMGQPVVNGALMTCTMGVAPATLAVIPVNRVLVDGQPQATIMDHVPFLNIPPFGVCNSLGNPPTAALTAAALGVLTPGPCIPATAAPWLPGEQLVKVGNMPLLDNASKCMCVSGGGQISITFAGA